eukprot:gene2586-3547_t
MGLLKKLYIILFNLVMLSGWSLIIFTILSGFSLEFKNVFASVENPLKFIQALAFLECVHGLFGLVNSPFATSFIQTLGKN